MIIGNGGAGVSALQTIREVDKKSNITIISREQYPAYSPCSLPNLIGGEIDKPTIFRFDKQFYNRLNAIFLKNTEVIQVFPSDKEINLANNKIIKFDKLLIAVRPARSSSITNQMAASSSYRRTSRRIAC